MRYLKFRNDYYNIMLILSEILGFKKFHGRIYTPLYYAVNYYFEYNKCREI